MFIMEKERERVYGKVALPKAKWKGYTVNDKNSVLVPHTVLCRINTKYIYHIRQSLLAQIVEVNMKMKGRY